MSKVEASNNSDSSKESNIVTKKDIKREKEQDSNASYIEQNDMTQIKALIPVLNSGEAILSDDETPKIIWNLDTSDKGNMSDSNQHDKTIETIEVIESGCGEDGNEVTIMLEFTSNESNDGNPCKEFTVEQQAKPKQKSSDISKSQIPTRTDPDESIAEIAKRQLETLASGQKRGRRPKSNESYSSATSMDKSKLTKLKSKDSSMYIEIVSEDTNKVQLPMHLLGRNKENPELDVLSNGRKTAPARLGLKIPQATLSSDILTSSEVKKIVSEKLTKKTPIVTVIDNRVLDKHEKIELASITSPKVSYSSTIPSAAALEASKKESGIEIPQEYLYSDIKTEENYGITETTVTNDTYDEDLLAILEGDHEPSEPPTPKIIEDTSCSVERRIYVHHSTIPQMSEELTRQIAMQQLMSLPKKVAKPKSNTLVEILTSDWSDTERKSTEEVPPPEVKTEIPETKPLPDVVNKIKSPLLNKSPSPQPLQIPQKSIKKIEKSVSTPATNAPATNLLATNASATSVPATSAPTTSAPAFKRTRIIKKKIIWDPDAPETQISYASLVQGNQAKRAVIKKAVVVQSSDKSSRNDTPSPIEPNDTRKRTNSTSPSPSRTIPKKKKISELDKLLGDEGAINMLNALEREHQKTPIGDEDKKTRMISKTRQVVVKPTVDDTPQTIIVSSPKSKQKREIVLPKSVTLKSIPKKRTREGSAGPKGRNSWDYVYSQRGGDDSLIIRRRSNSSYSSSTSPRRLSLEISNDGTSAKKEKSKQPGGANRKLASKTNKSSNFQFVKPNAKELTSKSSPAGDGKTNKKPAGGHPKQISEKLDSKLSIENNSTLPVVYLDNYIQFNLTEPNQLKSKLNYLTYERMGEITKLLRSIENDDQYNCVLISSTDGNFCEGLDLSPLCTGTWDSRKKAIKEFSMGLIQFLLALLHFNKPLIAGVQGVCSNLGVTILPLFDYVIADSTANFSTDYAKIGQIPEGFVIASQPNKLKHSMICDLFYLCQTIPAAVAMEGGLITHNIKSGVYSQHLLSECKTIASHSIQALQAMKIMKHRIDNNKKIESDLIEEQKILLKHWATDECQRNLEDKFAED